MLNPNSIHFNTNSRHLNAIYLHFNTIIIHIKTTSIFCHTFKSKFNSFISNHFIWTPFLMYILSIFLPGCEPRNVFLVSDLRRPNSLVYVRPQLFAEEIRRQVGHGLRHVLLLPVHRRPVLPPALHPRTCSLYLRLRSSPFMDRKVCLPHKGNLWRQEVQCYLTTFYRLYFDFQALNVRLRFISLPTFTN